jgi:hypothetical protein
MKSRFPSAGSAAHINDASQTTPAFVSDRLLNTRRGLRANRPTKTTVKPCGHTNIWLSQTESILMVSWEGLLLALRRCWRLSESRAEYPYTNYRPEWSGTFRCVHRPTKEPQYLAMSVPPARPAEGPTDRCWAVPIRISRLPEMPLRNTRAVLDDPRRLATDTTMVQSYGFSRQQSLFGDWLDEFEAREGHAQK